jgi:hypothetical protein
MRLVSNPETDRVGDQNRNYSEGGVGTVRGQSPSSMGESFFFPLYQARKYVLTSWYCNSFILSEGCKPEFWIGRSGGAAKNVRGL